MMADAAGEAMSVVRFCDDESMDPAFLADQVASFLSRVEGLFGPNAQCLTKTGYTSFLIETLRVPLVWVMQNTTCSLSAPSNEDIAYALDRMRGWLKLAAAESRVEFPSFKIVVPL